MTRSQGMIGVLARLADRPDSGVRRLPEAADGEPRYSIDFHKFEGSPRVRRRVALGQPWRAGITRAMEPPRRSPLPLARLAAHITQCGAIRVVAVGGEPDGVMTLTYGRIVCDPITARPKYALAGRSARPRGSRRSMQQSHRTLPARCCGGLTHVKSGRRTPRRCLSTCAMRREILRTATYRNLTLTSTRSGD